MYAEKKKHLITLIGLILSVLVLLTGCASASAESVQTAPEPTAEPTPRAPYHAEVLLDGDTAQIIGPGVTLKDGILTVTEGGVYRLSGDFAGAVRVNAKNADVELVLDGVSITGDGCAIYGEQANSLRLAPAANTENLLSDGAQAALTDSSAAVYTECELILGGEGSLTVSGLAGNGIESRRGLTVEGANLTVKASDDGLKGRGQISVTGGTIKVECGGEGVSASSLRGGGNGDVTIAGGGLTILSAGHGIDAEGEILLADGDVFVTTDCDGMHAGTTLSVAGGAFTAQAADEGLQAENSLEISGGRIDITAGNNGIRSGGGIVISDGTIALVSAKHAVEAVTQIAVSGGQLSIQAGGGGGNAINQVDGGAVMGGGWNQGATMSSADQVTGKGLKCDGDIIITGGDLQISSSDDAIHSSADILIEDGSITIITNDDAMHGDVGLVINGGQIDIQDCFEGLEAYTIDLNGGDLRIRAVNDGVNANGPETMNWNQTQTTEGETYIRMTGGTLDVVITGNSQNLGDGMDSNGSFYFDGGVLTVSTFGGTMESGIDYGSGSFIITGGAMIAAGSSSMAETISTASTQCCALLLLNSLAPAGTEVVITDSSGNVVWSAVMTNTFNSVVITHPDLQLGQVYTVTMGSQTATMDFTQSTVINQSGGMGGMGGMGGRF